jgi:predicted enzyme related to lactoylglutathione lyase
MPYVLAVPEVTGIGGVFIRARDAEVLRRWYTEHLGISIDGDSGAQFTWTSGGSSVFAIFEASSPYFGRPDQPCMINFRVDDLAAMLARLRAAGVEVIEETAEAEYGKFGWGVDPEGNRFELWQPPAGA